MQINFCTQGIFFNLYTLFYMLSPKHCHAFVGYLEEEVGFRHVIFPPPTLLSTQFQYSPVTFDIQKPEEMLCIRQAIPAETSWWHFTGKSKLCWLFLHVTCFETGSSPNGQTRPVTSKTRCL